MTRINKGWAVAQIAVFVFATSGAAFPLIASAHQFHSGHNQNFNNNWDNEHDHGDSDEGDTNEDVTGSITVCKILLNEEGGVIDGSSLPGSGFSVTLSKGSFTDWATFNTPLDLDTAFLSEEENDAQCETFPDLPLGLYSYDEEGIESSASFEDPLYNDQFTQEVNSTSDFYSYNESGNGENADGTITLTVARPNRTLVVLNHLTDPACTETQHLDNHICVDNAPVDPTCTTGQHLDNHVCVADTTTTATTTTDTTVTTTTTGGGHGHSHGSNAPKGQVLGASCGVYMGKHIKFGSSKNDSEQVTKLQSFLNKWVGAKLTLTGIYDADTLGALKAFQAKYSDQILKPWNVGAPTGLVYLSTLRQINLLECPELSLPLPELVPWNQNPSAQ